MKKLLPPREKAFVCTSLTSSCIVMYVGMACIVRNDDVSFTRNRRVKKRIRKTSFGFFLNELLSWIGPHLDLHVGADGELSGIHKN